jgi:hypothetical protein
MRVNQRQAADESRAPEAGARRALLCRRGVPEEQQRSRADRHAIGRAARRDE